LLLTFPRGELRWEREKMGEAQRLEDEGGER
jgi:hypothetical protein